MFNRRYIPLFYYLFFTGSSYCIQSQSVQYLPTFDFPVSGNHSLQVTGKVGNNYLLYHTMPAAFPEIILFNAEGQVTGIRTLDFIRPGVASHVNLVSLPERLNLIFQEVREDKHYAVVASLNQDGQLIEPPRYIDSTRFDVYGAASFLDVINSPDKKTSLLYRVIQGFSSTQILFNGILLGENNEVIGKSSFYIPFNTEQEKTGTPFLTNQGMSFLPVYDKAKNYHIGATVRIFQPSFINNDPPLVTELYLKENKPGEVMLDWYASKNQIVLGALYYNFYSGNIEGSMTAYITPGAKMADTVIYIPLEKDFKKELKSHISGISSNEVANTLQASYFKVADNGSVLLLTNIFTNSSFSGNPQNTIGSTSQNDSWQTKSANPYRNQSTSQNNFSPSKDIATARSANSNINTRSNLNDRASGSALDRNRTSPNTNISPQNFINAENNRLNSPYNYSAPALDAGDILARSKTMDYKSVLFTIDPSQTKKWVNWTRHLYVPGTSFSNIIVSPAVNSIALFNYEVNNQNMPYLYRQVFQEEEKVIRQIAEKPGKPMLFYKKNAVLLSNNSMLTLYADEQENKVGLAIVKW